VLIAQVQKELLRVAAKEDKTVKQLATALKVSKKVVEDSIEPLLTMRFLEQMGEFYSTTDLGVDVAVLEGLEIPDNLLKKVGKAAKADKKIRIHRPGYAANILRERNRNKKNKEDSLIDEQAAEITRLKKLLAAKDVEEEEEE